MQDSFSFVQLLKRLFFGCLLLIYFTVLNVFIAIGRYDSYDSYIYTLIKYDYYLARTNKYTVSSYETDRSAETEAHYQRMEETDRSAIQEKVDNQIPIYPSYLLMKSLQDLTNFTFPSNYTYDAFNGYHFNHVIIVDDFSTFHQPLLDGEYPERNHEVLIYDYMAHFIINKGNLPNINRMSDLIGKTLTDPDTGFEIKITGILKSHFRDFVPSIELDTSEVYEPEIAYLRTLRTLIATPDMIEQLEHERDYRSIESIGFEHINDENQTLKRDHEFRKLKLTTDLDDLNIIHTYEDEWEAGIYLSNHQLAFLLDVPVEAITPEFMDENRLAIIGSVYSPIRGIYETDAFDPHVLIDYQPDQTLYDNGRFMTYYLSLSTDWSQNKKILLRFIKSEQAYKNLVNIKNTDYTHATPFTHIYAGPIRYNDSIYNVYFFTKLGRVIMKGLSIITIIGILLFFQSLTEKHKVYFRKLKREGKRYPYFYGRLIGRYIPIIAISYLLSFIPTIKSLDILNRWYTRHENFKFQFFNFAFTDLLTRSLILTIISILAIVTFTSWVIRPSIFKKK